MTNYERRIHMTAEEMAKSNVRYVTDAEVDYDYEENPYTSLVEKIQTSDGELFWSEEDAIAHEIEWLNAEAK
jgi:hypothetical protein